MAGSAWGGVGGYCGGDLVTSSKTDVAWVAWLLSVGGSFAFLEGYALTHREDTLSRFTWKTSKAWPPLGVIYGMLVGGLAVHFFWTGNPYLIDPE